MTIITRLQNIEDTLVRIEGKLDRVLAGPRFLAQRSEPSLPIPKEQVIERYKELRHMGAVSGEFGVSHQRIQQIIVEHTKRTGEKFEKIKFSAPIQRLRRVEWTCASCGVKRLLSPSLAMMRKCNACSLADRRKISDEQMEAAITRLRAAGRGKWSALAREWKIPRNQTFSAQRMVFKFLERHSRLHELWPDTVPHWLRSHQARRKL